MFNYDQIADAMLGDVCHDDRSFRNGEQHQLWEQNDGYGKTWERRGRRKNIKERKSEWRAEEMGKRVMKRAGRRDYSSSKRQRAEAKAPSSR